MRVLHIISTLSSGGAEKMLIDIVREMKNQDIQCEVIVLTRKGDFFGNKLSKLGIPVHYSKAKKVYSIKNILFIRNIVKKNQYDCIHTHLFAPQIFTVLALIFNNYNYTLVTTEHSTHNRRRDNKLFYMLDRLMYEKYDNIIAISEGTKSNLNEYLPQTKEKTVVIENGIQLEEYENATPLLLENLDNSLKNNEKIILMVASMRNQKDHETLIRASKLLPDDYRVVFVGDGERLSDVKNYASKYGRNNILFLGRRSDVPSIMASSDVFVLSSKWEGFGLVVVEAAATGLPVVASNVIGLREIVDDIGGYLFEAGNEKDLAKQIIYAINNKEELSSKKRLQKYSIEKTVSSYIELYKKVIRSKNI